MSYSEIEFYLAEAASRGWSVGGTAESHYDNGITASIVDDWSGDAGAAAAYLANTNVAFSTAPGTELQRIALQSWLASYDRGLIGWTTYRRLDAPVLNVAALTHNPVPARYTYPAVDQTLNATNYTAAAADMGGDLQTSKIFWDVH